MQTAEAADLLGGLALGLVRPEGFEPPISAFGGPRVIQLRYGREDAGRLLPFLG